MTIDFPNTVKFQHFSCTVTGTVGFSNRIKCGLNGQKATISRLFDNGYNRDSIGNLKLSVEMLEMPKSEQNLGLFTVKMFDQIAGVPGFLEIDVYEQSNITSIAGDVKKEAEVTTSSKLASAGSVSYTFEFKLYHSLPVGGFFRIDMSTDSGSNDGVTMPDPAQVTEKCILDNGG